MLLGILALVAVALTVTGLYGLIYLHRQPPDPEIGVRIALGATQRAVIRLIVSDGLRITVGGVTIGVLLALAGCRVLNSLLVGVSSSDPISFAMAIAILSSTALLSSYIPARKASRIDPVHSLRQE